MFWFCVLQDHNKSQFYSIYNNMSKTKHTPQDNVLSKKKKKTTYNQKDGGMKKNPTHAYQKIIVLHKILTSAIKRHKAILTISSLLDNIEPHMFY